MSDAKSTSQNPQTDDQIKQLVQQQFGASAQNFVTSFEHRQGDDLQRLVDYAKLRGDERVLDVATGGGHTALAFSRKAREVIATDLTAKMVAAATAFLAEQGANNVTTQLADAEALPFSEGSFDVVTARIAPHHFANPQRFVKEAARVLKPGGRFLLDDNMAPEDDALDQFMNRYEKWRDPSHVRAWRLSEWQRFVETAGLVIEHSEALGHKKYGFIDWTERMYMPEKERAALEAWLLEAPANLREYFHVTIEAGRVISLTATFAILVARKPATR